MCIAPAHVKSCTSMLYLKNIFVQKTSDCILYFARFDVLVEVSMKIGVFIDVTPCRQVQIYRHFGGICRHHLQGRRSYSATLKEEAICFSKTKFIQDYTMSHPRRWQSVVLHIILTDGKIHVHYKLLVFGRHHEFSVYLPSYA